jgi:peptidoglycan hydrolase-like protein with peptidoglycan-binding domain
MIASAACCLVAIAGALAAGGDAAARGRTAPVHARSYRLGDRVLAAGMNGADVFHLQVLLARRGFSVSADRAFGAQTRAAVQRAQRAYGLVADGVVGWLTLTALRHGGPPSCADAPGPGDPVTRWLPVVTCALRLLHLPQTAEYANDVLLVIAHESGGNPAAMNGWDINAKRGDPSRGLMQVIGRVFVKYRSPALPNNIFDPAANVYAALAYATAVYGSISKIPGVKSVAAGHGYIPYKRGASR